MTGLYESSIDNLIPQYSRIHVKYISTRLSALYNTYQSVKKELKIRRLEGYFRRMFRVLSVRLAQMIFKEKFGFEKKGLILVV